MVLALLGVCLGLGAGCSWTPRAVAHSDQESNRTFDQLASLEIASDHLYESIAGQADVVGFSRQLEAQSDLASPFTSSELERIAQSFASSLRVLLFDLAPPRFWETHLAQYYASMLSLAEAKSLAENYDSESLSSTSRVRELRRNFIADRLPGLLPSVRARAHPYQISTEAMVPVLLPGDHVIVHKAAYFTHPPQRGDVIVYRYPDEEGTRFLHRVIGIPGDRIEVRNKVVLVNDGMVPEPYVQHTDASIITGTVRDNLGPLIVPSDTYFVLADNREESLDSRFLGPISRDHISGQVVFIYWSVDLGTKRPRWERLNRPVR